MTYRYGDRPMANKDEKEKRKTTPPILILTALGLGISGGIYYLTHRPKATSLHGIVTDSRSQAALEGVEVRLGETGIAYTDAIGLYRFDNLAPGTYDISLSLMPNYQDVIGTVVLARGDNVFNVAMIHEGVPTFSLLFEEQFSWPAMG